MKILRPGENVWRIEHVGRAAVIIDAANYFGAVRAALLKAERKAFIIGWDIHSRTRLVGPGGRADDGYPENFAEFLSALVERKPQLEISLLLWDFAVLYAAEREPFPSYSLRWNTPRRIRLCLDDAVPIGSSQHQKLVVIDDAIAFTGGIDITARRWDTSEHEVYNPLRRDPAGTPYAPFHDVQMLLDGGAARALAQLARARWECAANETIPLLESSGDPWPDHVAPDFTDLNIGIARTQPNFETQEQVREIERLYFDSIAAAERSIYIENQFLSCIPVAEALARRLHERPALELLIVTPATHASWIEARTMRNGRIRFAQVLREAGADQRVRMVSPIVRSQDSEEHTMVHSKVMIVDDTFLYVGSANLNNRSMGTDTECNIAVEAQSETERETIAATRNRLIADHCGVDADTVAQAFSRTGSLVGLADLSGHGHALAPIDDGPVDQIEWATYLEGIADPEAPIGAEEFAGTILGGRISRRSLSRITKLVLGVIVVLALVLAWKFTPLAELAQPDRIRDALESFADGNWGPLIVLGIFVGSSVLLFPVTVLIAATAAAFGPWLGFAYSAVGALLSALISFMIGAMIGREALTSVLGPRLNRIRREVRNRGVIAVAVVRLVPVAPFGVINLVAGASKIRLLDFTLGTAIGMLPGIAVMAALGHQITLVLTRPSLEAVIWFALAIAAWLALSLGLQALVSRYWSEAS
jgi:phospholipase D1/2